MRFRAPQSLLTLAVALPLLIGTSLHRLGAMPPPTPEMVKQYKADGSLQRRIAAAKAIGNHRVDPELAQDAQRRLQQLAGLPAAEFSSTTSNTPPSGWRGLPTKGTPKMFVLLIDFSDYPAAPVNTVAAVTARTFGDGDSAQVAPYESLKSYYYRSSYGQLTITGDVLAYYRPAYTRASMPTSGAAAQQARQNLIKEALQYHAAQGHDFSQYDNNNSGKIDYFAVLWTGPDAGWGSDQWWAFQTSWNNSVTPLTLNGKTLRKYVWQWASNAEYPTRNAPNFDPKVLIHETGHALGLPDYYDYDDTVGPKGGVGGLDMMDANKGDHNCFSKFLLDWISPTVYTSSAAGLSLLSSGDTKDNNAIIVMDSNPGSAFGEYFMVQNRQRVGNDAGANYPADGLLIWHVDSRLDPATSNADYLYDNSYTSHKLLRLMEADGLEQIERGYAANAGDYWINGKDFGPASRASSIRYDGTVTKMGVRNISVPGASMTLDVYQVTDTTAPTGKPGTPAATTTDDTMTFTWTSGTAVDAESGIAGYRLQVGTTPGGTDVFDGGVGNVLTWTLNDLGLQDGVTLYARVAAMNGAGLLSAYSDSSAGLAINLAAFSGSIVDNANLAFKTLGPWAADTTTFTVGSSSAKSFAISDNSRTYLQAKVAGPGTLTFDWKVNSELNYDFLTFSIDGVDQAGAISGTTAFANKTFAIPTGSHVVRWTYAKDQSTAPTGDAAWVDNVQWTGVSSVSAVISPASYTTITSGQVPFTSTVSNFASNNSANWTVNNSGGSFSPATTTSGAATIFTGGTSAGTFTITATPVETPNTPGTASLTLVSPSSVSVTLTASATTVVTGANITLTPSVSVLTDKNVTWSSTGGTFGATSGTSATWSSATGGSFTLTATSSVATARSGQAVVTVVDPSTISIAVSPSTKILLPGGSQLLTASGDQGYGVTWTLTGPAGVTKADNGLQTTLTVPSAAPTANLTYTVKATSALDSTRFGTATITVKSMDLDASGVVDVRDLLIMAKEWGQGASAASNLKGSGTVNTTDLDVLLGKL